MSEQIVDSRIKEEHSDFISLFEYKKLIHDLRNSLSPILMQAQLLSQHAENAGSEGEAIKNCAEAIERSVKTMAKLLDSK